MPTVLHAAGHIECFGKAHPGTHLKDGGCLALQLIWQLVWQRDEALPISPWRLRLHVGRHEAMLTRSIATRRRGRWQQVVIPPPTWPGATGRTDAFCRAAPCLGRSSELRCGSIAASGEM